MTPDRTITFVRDTLGCRCPEELFREIHNEVELAEGPLFQAFADADPALIPFLDRVLAVGGRLLVAVTRASRRDLVVRMLEAGCAVRDQGGFNRFRLAIVSSGDSSGMDVPGDLHDDRCHLHCIDHRIVPNSNG